MTRAGAPSHSNNIMILTHTHTHTRAQGGPIERGRWVIMKGRGWRGFVSLLTHHNALFCHLSLSRDRMRSVGERRQQTMTQWDTDGSHTHTLTMIWATLPPKNPRSLIFNWVREAEWENNWIWRRERLESQAFGTAHRQWRRDQKGASEWASQWHWNWHWKWGDHHDDDGDEEMERVSRMAADCTHAQKLNQWGHEDRQTQRETDTSSWFLFLIPRAWESEREKERDFYA